MMNAFDSIRMQRLINDRHDQGQAFLTKTT